MLIKRKIIIICCAFLFGVFGSFRANAQWCSATINLTDTIMCFGDDATIQVITLGGAFWNTQFLYLLEYNIFGNWYQLSTQTTYDTATFTLLPANNYRVTVTDPSGIYTAQAFINITQPPNIMATFSITNPSLCFGDSVADLHLNVFGGTPPYTVTLNGGPSMPITANNIDFLNVPAGSYQVIITDANGCTKIRNQTITPGNGVCGCTDSLALNFNATATVDDSTCYYCSITTNVTQWLPTTVSACDGFINVTTSGTAPYAYSWNNGNTTALNLNLCDGAYTYTVIDSNGCGFTETIILTAHLGCTDSTAMNYNPTAIVDDGSCIAFVYGCTDSTATNYNPAANTDDGSCMYCDIQITQLVTNPNTLGNCDGWAMVQATSSYSTPTYSWSNSFSGSFNMGLCLGMYTVTASDIYGCTVDSTISIGNVVLGCTDSTATNYNPLATVDDGSCTYSTTCNSPVPTGLSVTDLTHDRAKINWLDANTSVCLVEMYRVQYREQGTTAWSTKTALGSGLCNFGLLTTSKMLWNLTPSTIYEYRVKAWYCSSSASIWSPISIFTTLDPCPNVLNFAVSTPTNTRATFTWTAPSAPYSFVRIKLRVDTTNASWFTAGGYGVYYPALTRNKNGLTPGQSYRASSRTWCNPSGGAHKALTWTSFIFWTQPGSLIRVEDESSTAITDLEVYPNPSRDIFNVTFTSEDIQTIEVRVISLLGEVIFTENKKEFVGQYTKQFDLATYPKGIYMLEIETNSGVVNKKLILQ